MSGEHFVPEIGEQSQIPIVSSQSLENQQSDANSGLKPESSGLAKEMAVILRRRTIKPRKSS